MLKNLCLKTYPKIARRTGGETGKQRFGFLR